MNKFILYLLLFSVMQMAEAGFNGRTQHSRANCVNNETITWDATRDWILQTISIHIDKENNQHKIVTPWEDTWRSAAVHWREALPGSGWRVTGIHWYSPSRVSKPIFIELTNVTDCSIYDGWWDKNIYKVILNDK